MRFKIITLLAIAIGFASCDDVDTNRLLGIDDNTKVETKVEETEEVEFEEGATEWEKSYEIDIDKDYPDYAENIKHVDFKAFLYQVTVFQGAGDVKSGKVDVYMADPNRLDPETKTHKSFANDVSQKTVYKIEDQDKINKVKETFEKQRKANFVFKVTLDEPAPKGFKMGFKFDFDMEVSGDLSNLDLDGLKDKNNN